MGVAVVQVRVCKGGERYRTSDPLGPIGPGNIEN